ncbi:MAG: peptidase domain-containing ABC transporter [Aureispira sp.]|nr:peptidase domain-containing ABC transporter [Aureispira sp.]
MAKFPFYRQLDMMDCGPTCLRMIAKYHGKSVSLEHLRKHTYMDREGVSLQSIGEAAETIGFQTIAVMLDYNTLLNDVPLPCIAHWKQNHFIVVYKVTKKHIWVADPAKERIKYTRQEFEKHWASTVNAEGQKEGILMALEVGGDFDQSSIEEPADKASLWFLWKYAKKYKKLWVQMGLGLIISTIVNIAFPFLTQAIVDVGINTQNLNFIYVVIAAQLMLYFAQVSAQVIRMWIMLHVTTRINISLVSDFLIKLMRLPISFFGTKMTGDLLRRINDHIRIDNFLTNTLLLAVFSSVNLVIFTIVLALFNFKIFTVFLIGSILYVLWVYFFMNRQRTLDYQLFEQQANDQNKIMELINGMQEIKLQNSEQRKRWEWERIQAKLFKVKMSSLKVRQYQLIGSDFVNEIKNITITLIAAQAVLDGSITLGAMLAIQYIIGQANVPLKDLPTYMMSTQEAKISLERLNEIHTMENEGSNLDQGSDLMVEQGDFVLKNLWFQYGGPTSPVILKDVNLTIPSGKVTAIVGTSGSGKTTLLKLLLKFYEPTRGEIHMSDLQLSNVNNRYWRGRCGSVMQDGYIFEDTIAKNIAVSDEHVDKVKLLKAVKIANIKTYIESLPLGYNTKIGNSGVGLSQGQRQRILIARAVYKNPDFLFFDEATNALDAKNEKAIVENLDRFFEGKTVIVVAHRLSTVKNADQIVVIEQGEILEVGSHKELAAAKGAYFNLVKNQLELGG